MEDVMFSSEDAEYKLQELAPKRRRTDDPEKWSEEAREGKGMTNVREVMVLTMKDCIEEEQTVMKNRWMWMEEFQFIVEGILHSTHRIKHKNLQH